ncbi:Protein of unknown function, partial [Gryllus bimaculatus]
MVAGYNRLSVRRLSRLGTCVPRWQLRDRRRTGIPAFPEAASLDKASWRAGRAARRGAARREIEARKSGRQPPPASGAQPSPWPRPPPRPRSGGRPSRVLLLAAEGCGADEGYVQPRSFPAPAPAPAAPRAHSYLLVVGGDPAGAATPAYEEVLLQVQAPGADEGYLPMQRHRLPTVLRAVRGAALETGAVGVARDHYLSMKPLAPPVSRFTLADGR